MLRAQVDTVTGNVCDRETYDFLRSVAPDVRAVRGDWDDVRRCPSLDSLDTADDSVEHSLSAYINATAWTITDRLSSRPSSRAVRRQRRSQLTSEVDGRRCANNRWNASVRPL